MKSAFRFIIATAICAICSSVWALYGVTNRGTWPDSWPKELEPLRAQARTYTGPMLPQPHYVIGFAKREDFESAWPHILEVKTKVAPVILLRSPHAFFECKAGVIIHCPPPQNEGKAMPEEPLAGEGSDSNVGRWMYTTVIELVVDGDIVDLNRLKIPEGARIEAGANAKRDFEIEKFVIERKKKQADAEREKAK